MQKVPYVFPIVGGRKVEHLHANLKALDVALTDAHIRKIETAVPFELGVPHDLAVSPLRPSPLFWALVMIARVAVDLGRWTGRWNIL